MAVFVARTLTIPDADSCGKLRLDYDERTKDFLLAVNNASITTAQKDLLDAFFVGVIDNGLLPKITRLYLPSFSFELAKAFINSAASMGVDVVPNANFALVSGEGVKAETTGSQLYIPIDSDVITSHNMHCFSIPFEALVDPDTIRGNASPYGSIASSIRFQINAMGTIANSNSYVAGRNMQNNNSVSNARIGDADGSGLYGWSILGDEMIGGAGDVYDLPEYNNGTPVQVTTNPTLTGYLDNYMIVPNCLISFGKGFTQAEFAIYKQLCETLAAGIGAEIN